MDSDIICKFFRNGHCKFGDHCQKSHSVETCRTFPCLNESCPGRHPPRCKYFSRLGRCKFKELCSYLHYTDETNFLKIRKEIDNLVQEIEKLKDRNQFLQSVVMQLESLEKEVKDLKVKTNSPEAHENNEEQSLLNPNQKQFYCELCEFVSNSKKGVRIHTSAKHNENSKPPIVCIRSEDGCANKIDSYYNADTAVCTSCTKMLDSMQKSSPYSHSLCPCCHELSEEGNTPSGASTNPKNFN